MAWWYLTPLESSSLRNITRYDHHFVSTTQEGLRSSPGYIERLVDEDPIKKCNVFGPEDTQNILQTPQFVPADLLMELLSSSLVKQKDNPNTIGGTGKHKGKRFDVATSEVQVNTSSSGQLVEQPQLSNYPKTVEVEIKPEQYPGDTLGRYSTIRPTNLEFPVNGKGLAIVAVPPDFENETLQTLLKERLRYDTLTVDRNAQITGEVAKKRDHKMTSRKKNRATATSSDGAIFNASSSAAAFDDSIDADDEASSSKTISSENEELQQTISAISKDSLVFHASLYRTPYETFGFTADTTLGKKMYVKEVDPGSLAFLEGLSPGDHIIAVNNKIVGIDQQIDFKETQDLFDSSFSLRVVAAKCSDMYQKIPCKRLSITIKNCKDGLGISIGKNDDNKIVIKNVATGGLAFKDGRLKKGDQILKIGQIFIEELSTEEVGKLLKNCGTSVQLEVLQPMPNFPKTSKIVLRKSAKYGLGLGVAIYTSKLNQTCTVVRNILPQSPANKCSKIELGDEILTINDRHLCDMMSSDILDLLKDPAIKDYTFCMKHRKVSLEANKLKSGSKERSRASQHHPCCSSTLARSQSAIGCSSIFR